MINGCAKCLKSLTFKPLSQICTMHNTMLELAIGYPGISVFAYFFNALVGEPFAHGGANDLLSACLKLTWPICLRRFNLRNDFRQALQTRSYMLMTRTSRTPHSSSGLVVPSPRRSCITATPRSRRFGNLSRCAASRAAPISA